MTSSPPLWRTMPASLPALLKLPTSCWHCIARGPDVRHSGENFAGSARARKLPPNSLAGFAVLRKPGLGLCSAEVYGAVPLRLAHTVSAAMHRLCRIALETSTCSISQEVFTSLLKQALYRAQGRRQAAEQKALRDPPKNLEQVASQLLAGPKAAVHSCQQTFENAQHNWSLLGESLLVRLTDECLCSHRMRSLTVTGSQLGLCCAGQTMLLLRPL